ncbi:MAG: histidine--tRNA ligase [Bdellovibrionota bacterium]
MAQTLQPVRGTRDLLPEELKKFRLVEETAVHLARLYGFGEIETPVLESSALFKRGLGDTSDIVSKEMYAFQDLGGDELVLRPEGTAGVARAFISEGLTQHLPLKLFYRGPMFRRERPQKGRYRQFYQMGVELLGVDKAQADLEVIALAHQILTSLPYAEGFGSSITLHLNTIGDAESRLAFREKLTSYFMTRKSELSADSLTRLEKNPLRILDSKDEGDKRVVKDAPALEQSLNDVSKKFFDDLVSGLDRLKIPYVIDPLLVRGLDYYCHTVFEFTTDALGAQNAVLAGGRYDNLISDLGGPKTPGVGWAAGIDRLALMLKPETASLKPVAVVPIGDDVNVQASMITHQLRQMGVPVDLGYSGNLSKRLNRANKIGAAYAVIFGAAELARNIVQFKNLGDGTQQEIPLLALFDNLSKVYADMRLRQHIDRDKFIRELVIQPQSK